MFAATPLLFVQTFGCHGLAPWRFHVREL